MGLSETLVFYTIVGLAVATAVYQAGDARGAWERRFHVLTATAFWPLYLPLLLSRTASAPRREVVAKGEPIDEMAAAIRQVDAELQGALSSLDGWAENVLAREQARLGELHAALVAQSQRIREMDLLIAQTQCADDGPPCATGDVEPLDRRGQSERARRQNLLRLRDVRRRAYDDLMGTLAWVRELVSMIHLAKFTGAPASRAEELVAQIAAAVEGVSEVAWRDEEEGKRGRGEEGMYSEHEKIMQNAK
ncbi:MAG TPA: hypothetical protein VGX78_12495 [Pirellulales bacterium]|jgi:hypothetical protein|nr:hypothetical protein [Pirellulales bacterium]